EEPDALSGTGFGRFGPDDGFGRLRRAVLDPIGEVLDHRVGEEPARHLLDLASCVLRRGGLELERDVLTDPDPRNTSETERGHALLDGLALRIEDALLEHHVDRDPRFHRLSHSSERRAGDALVSLDVLAS